MRELELPYPLLVGRVDGGTWSSQVPDRLEFEGRLGVPVGADLAAARAALEAVVASALADGEAPVESSGRAARSRPARRRPTIRGRASCAAPSRTSSARGAARVGVPYGADMRLFCARGIPCVMVGTTGIERAHAVDEWVAARRAGRAGARDRARAAPATIVGRDGGVAP